MDKLNMLVWQLTATENPISSFSNFLSNVLNQLSAAIESIQTPFMLAIGVVAGVTLLWRILSSDDPNETPRAIRAALILVGGAAIALYVAPGLLKVISGLVSK